MIPSYTIGVLQSRAYRTLKKTTATILVPWKITPVDWAILGALAEEKGKMNITDVAQYLGVATPLVTRRVNALSEKKLVQREFSQGDRRVRMVILTSAGESLIREVEPVLRNDMKKLIEGLALEDYLGYIRVISNIANLERR